MNELISVIIPAYNHEQYVQETMLSIINQTYKNIELIIVNDGSSDNTNGKILELEDSCKQRFKNFVYIQKQNNGVSEALNDGIDAAKGKYVYIIASDDVAKPEAISVLYDFIKDKPEYAVVVGDDEFIDLNSKIIGLDREKNVIYEESYTCNRIIYRTAAEWAMNCHNKFKIDFNSDDFGTYATLLYGCYITNGYLINKQAILDVGKYKKNIQEDAYMFLQLSKKYKLKYLDRILFSYRVHPNNSQKNQDYLNEIAKNFYKNEKDYAYNNGYKEVYKARCACQIFNKIPQNIEKTFRWFLRLFFKDFYYFRENSPNAIRKYIRRHPKSNHEKAITNELISVIIPAYNHEQYVQETMLSIINQTYENIELIIINDGSSDNTNGKILELEESCKQRFKKIVYIQKQNNGVSEALNDGIDVAMGKYVYIIASDDVAEPEAISVLYDFIKDKPEYALVVGNNNFIDSDSDIVFVDRHKRIVRKADDKSEMNNNATTTTTTVYSTVAEWSSVCNNKFDIDFNSDDFGTYDTLLYNCYIPNGYLINKRAIVGAGKYVKDCAEDWYMFLQLAKTYKLKYINKILFNYRCHASNTQKDITHFLKIINNVFKMEKDYAYKNGYKKVYNARVLYFKFKNIQPKIEKFFYPILKIWFKDYYDFEEKSSNELRKLLKKQN